MKLTIQGKSGSLNQFVRKLTNTKGKIVEYPKIKGIRNINNPRHWAWTVTWKDKVNDKFISRSIRVPADRATRIKAMILKHIDVSEIQAFLKS